MLYNYVPYPIAIRVQSGGATRRYVIFMNIIFVAVQSSFDYLKKHTHSVRTRMCVLFPVLKFYFVCHRFIDSTNNWICTYKTAKQYGRGDGGDVDTRRTTTNARKKMPKNIKQNKCVCVCVWNRTKCFTRSGRASKRASERGSAVPTMPVCIVCRTQYTYIFLCLFSFIHYSHLIWCKHVCDFRCGSVWQCSPCCSKQKRQRRRAMVYVTCSQFTYNPFHRRSNK